MSDKPTRQETDDLRQFLGTLPARTNEEQWMEPNIVRGISQMDVSVVSPQVRDDRDKVRIANDIYRSLYEMSTSTWGDGNIGGNWKNKWAKSSPEARFQVVWYVLHNQTLPTAKETQMFTFQVDGIPRHCSDQVFRTRLGAGFGSIGSRDNSRLSCDNILYSNLYDLMEKDEKVNDTMTDALKAVKKAYSAILKHGAGSYQIARSILPMNAHSAFTVRQNMLSLFGMFNRRSCLGEEEFIVAYAWMVRALFKNYYGLNFLAANMIPPCYRAKKCFYAGSTQGFGGLAFSLLFAPNDPVCKPFVPPEMPDYAEFNESCTSSQELLDNGVEFMRPEDYKEVPMEWEAAKEFLSPTEVEAFELD